MKKLILIILTLGLFSTMSCNQNTDTSGWLVPADEVLSGGPGKDGIPSIDQPQWAIASDIDYLSDNDLVLAIKRGNTVKVYPHPILDWHEIINDEVDGSTIAVTYCPLTGTGIGWDRVVNGKLTTFGVSGLLYNSNLIPYDRETGSNWSQILLKCIHGPMMGTPVKTHPLLETTWATFQSMYPNAQVVTDQTGFNRDYQTYPYGSYRTDNRLIFPVAESDDRRPLKERVLGVVVNEQAKVYTFDSFEQPNIVTDSFAGTELIIVGSQKELYMVAYEQTFPDLVFEPASNPNDPSVVMTDDEGNEWNVFGEAVTGPRAGAMLNPVPSLMGYWFSWAAFYQGVEID